MEPLQALSPGSIIHAAVVVMCCPPCSCSNCLGNNSHTNFAKCMSCMCVMHQLNCSALLLKVLKLWSPRGEQQGVIRATAPFLAQRVGPVNCLEFHPYRLLLASGGGDPIIALYPIAGASADQNITPTASVADSPSQSLPSDTDTVSRPNSAS